jgi:hypothetical protein
MHTRTIPEDHWNDFLNAFSRQHVDKLVTVELLSTDSWPRVVAENLPLQGISLDTKGTRSSAIHVATGETASAMSHVIDLPLFIRQSDESDGSIELQIEPAQGAITLIHVGPPN